MSGILIVDDMAFFRQRLHSLFTGWGWSVCGEAADGAEAVRLYAKLGPSLVVLDLLMPGMDGFAALEAIQGRDRAARVIVCSVAGQRENVVRVRRLGAVDFLAKPVSEERLYQAVAAVIGPPPGRTGPPLGAPERSPQSDQVEGGRDDG